MNSEDRIKNQKALVEEVGRYFDKEGFQPIAGRIMGLLMVMDKEQFTFEEITEELGISKSSASNTLKNLEIRGDIEYVTIIGDRKRYFQLKRHDVFTMVDDFEKKMSIFKEMIVRVLDLKVNKESNNANYLIEINKMIELFSIGHALLKEKYKNN